MLRCNLIRIKIVKFRSQELCLYLDEERNGNCRSCGAGLRRDEGDGSSSGTNVEETNNIGNQARTSPRGHRSFNDEG